MKSFKEFLSEEELEPYHYTLNHEQEMAQHEDAHFKPEHIQSIERYKASSRDINYELRGDMKNSSKKWNEDYILPHIKNLDEVTSHKLENPMTVYRGLYGYKTEPGNLKPGDIYHDKGYTGTSLNPKRALNYITSDLNKVGPLAKIHVPSGSMGYYVDRHNTGYQYEKEFLLHRGTKFKVSHISEEKHPNPLINQKVHVIHMHVVGNEHTPSDELIK